MATLRLLLGSALLLANLYSSTANAQAVDPNAPLPPPPVYGDGQPVYQPPPSTQPYQPPPPGQPYQPYQPPPPVMAQPAPQPMVTPYNPYANPYRRAVRYRPQFGLGLRASGLYSSNDLLAFGQGGAELDLMLRVHPHLTLELSFGYHRTDRYDEYYSNYSRIDVPIIMGMRIHPGPAHWPVSPYLVVGAGADFASVDLPDIGESGVFGEVQGGGGVEFRLGRHFEFSVDIRGYGRFRSANSQAVYVMDEFGNSAPLLGKQAGVMFNAGFGVFF